MPTGPTRGAHGGIDFAPWWLNQIYWLDQINGARTLDVFDIHAYFGDNIDNSGFTNAQLRAEVDKYLRTYWDPAYYNAGDDADWIYHDVKPNRAIPFLIPRMKAMVNAIYPGTPLSFTEWESFFNEWEFATALSDADAFGVMGREGLSFSTRWGGPSRPTVRPISRIPTTSPSSCAPTMTGPPWLRHAFGLRPKQRQSGPVRQLRGARLHRHHDDYHGPEQGSRATRRNVTFNLTGFSAIHLHGVHGGLDQPRRDHGLVLAVLER